MSDRITSWSINRCDPRKPKPDHQRRSPAVILNTASDYRMELIETLADLASYQIATFADADAVAEIGPTLARIKAVARS